MIDNSDGESFWLASLFVENPWVSLVLLGIAIVFWCLAASNDADCHDPTKYACPAGQESKLIEHACQCVTPAQPVLNLSDFYQPNLLQPNEAVPVPLPMPALISR